MELFNKNIELKDWGSVYAGIKRQWLTPKEVIVYCEKGNIQCSEERHVELYLSYEDSLFSFLELIKKFVEEDKQPPILCNENSNNSDISCIPQEYWFFWEVEFLVRITKLKKDKVFKLYDVAAIHKDFNYPKAWNDFLYYMPQEEGKPLGIDFLYENLERYINQSIRTLLK